MRNLLPLTALLVGLLWGSLSAYAAEGSAFEEAAASLQAATLTVRIIPAAPAPIDPDAPASAEPASDEAAAKSAKSVTVFSGVSLGDGVVITSAQLSPEDEIRITIPGGEQAKANLRVVDHVSGLTLLEIDRKDVPGLKSATNEPKVGQWVLSAAGWGSEKPVVSLGILAATDRTIRGGNFPPLLQCDLRTAETSSGAAVVNGKGELLGVVVATDAPDSESRWTYAVPVSHVQRLVRARHPEKVIVIPRRRPIVGLKLIAGEEAGSVIIQQVDKDGPADKAGLREGDQVIAADGVKIRSVYEVVRPLLAKQPGDTMRFLIRRDEGERQGSIYFRDVVLEGGVVLNATVNNQPVQTAVVPRRIVIDPVNFQGYDVRSQEAPAAKSGPTPTEQQVQILQKAMESYGQAIATLKEELDRRDKDLAERDALIKSLQQQLEAKNKASAAQ